MSQPNSKIDRDYGTFLYVGLIIFEGILGLLISMGLEFTHCFRSLLDISIVSEDLGLAVKLIAELRFGTKNQNLPRLKNERYVYVIL